MQTWAIAFYHSQAWQDCRAAYIATRIGIDGGLCERCHKIPGKIVHHKQWLTQENIQDTAVTLGHSNLEYVCHACHNAEHIGGGEVPTRYHVDCYGCILPPSAPQSPQTDDRTKKLKKDRNRIPKGV